MPHHDYFPPISPHFLQNVCPIGVKIAPSDYTGFCGHCMDQPCSCPEQCTHEIIYDNMILLESPRKQNWICEKCGSQGISIIPEGDTLLYQELVDKFHGNLNQDS